ncbi:unnamed protein product [Anisakis simplex]|uniref:Sema domain-containing protein n=1 Tax=Anisakis simplex TaxID=6269 RepID=A0A0M3K6T1_ANISI|nr:unnamed protein product [Anisakis simplex]
MKFCDRILIGDAKYSSHHLKLIEPNSSEEDASAHASSATQQESDFDSENESARQKINFKLLIESRKRLNKSANEAAPNNILLDAHRFNLDEQHSRSQVIDPSTGRLYVGGVNNLYDLHASSLSVKAHAVTGPEEDSLECLNRESCNRKTPHNSYTKGLAVYEKGSKLIECSSLFQGRCRWRNLYNIDQKDVIRESQRNVVANDRFSSTVIFVGAGPPNDDGIPKINHNHMISISILNSMWITVTLVIAEDVLYVASTYAHNGSYWDDVPAVASLSLAQETLFDVSVQGVGTGTEIKMERQFRGQYKIEYVGGFQSGRFAYFATRQPKGYIPGGNTFPIISKLVRVCTSDAHFWSYTEVPLECSQTNVTYNLLTDVYLSKPGYDLASSLGISVEDDILYAVFVEGTGVDKSVPSMHSALFTGKFQNLPWFKSAERCQQTKFSGQEVLCGKDVNSYIGGDIAIESKPVLSTRKARFTAVATNTTRANTVAFIGTHDGRLLKAVVENRTAGFIYRSLDVGGGKPILQDLELDGTGDHVYVLTPSSVSYVTVQL